MSLDCWLATYVPQQQLPLAVQRQLALFVVSVGILLAVILLMSCTHVYKRVRKAWRRGGVFCLHGTGLWRKLRVAVLVVAFYAYPTLVKASLSFFACLSIDSKSKEPYPQYAVLNHTAGYWVQDIQQECFAGWHMDWALGFGVPAVVILCLNVQVCLCLFLVIKKKSIANPGFREHYGFLYRNYTDRWVWWEAVWAAQTVLLTAVSVFHFILQAYYALFAMCLVLLLSAGLQLMARPYAQKELHRLHLTSTWCLFFNAWLSIALLDGRRPGRDSASFAYRNWGCVGCDGQLFHHLVCLQDCEGSCPHCPAVADGCLCQGEGVGGLSRHCSLHCQQKMKQRNRHNTPQEISLASVDA
jgi:hypothetical protein